jgi:rifampicin phosphotransferase
LEDLLVTIPPMARPLILSLSDCTDSDMAGGKAAGLARLLAAGFDVPPGLCVTTEAYHRSLGEMGLSPANVWHRVCELPEGERQAALADCRARIRYADVSPLVIQWESTLQRVQPLAGSLWAVRSSATNEDAGQASFAGLYRSRLGVSFEHLGKAVADIWASVWQEPVMRYMFERRLEGHPPAMAVIIQLLLDARAAGVAYSIHPVTGWTNQVTINAVLGIAAPLVDGTAMPDEYVVEMSGAAEPLHVRRRLIADKRERLAPSAEGGLCRHPVSAAARHTSALSDEEVCLLARRVKQVEQAFGHPVDLEWVWDAKQFWILQARPITTVRPASGLTNDGCEWSRANFKETMPEVPSPLGLSFLESFMDAYILSHYRRLGCRIPDGLSAVRVLHGRPYLNVTLFHLLIGQLRGDPGFNVEQMGGQPLLRIPTVTPMGWPAVMRAAWLILLEMRRGMTCGPRWFAEMKDRAATYRPDRLRQWSRVELTAQLDALSAWLDGHEVTFGIVAGVGHCLETLGRWLPRWLGPDWRSLFNAALQGQGTVISAMQILRLADLAELARREPAVQQWFASDQWDPSSYRDRLAGTDFLLRFESFLREYGHRGVGESDVMSPRIADQPESILAILRTQLQAPVAVSGAEHLTRQAQCRREALAEIRRRLGWRWDRWLLFHWWYRRLTRFFALREANRHHLMYYSTAARHLLRQLGDRLVSEGRLVQADDIFFMTLDERIRLTANDPRDWKMLVAGRRADRARHQSITVPDTIRDWSGHAGMPERAEDSSDGPLRGMPISVGSVTGAVRLVRSPLDWHKVTPGDIVVAPVIDPGMAPLFGIAGGFIVEMGGTLSHGAIIAREYGLPTVANVEGAMTRLKEGQRVRLEANTGTIMEPHDS